MNKALHVDSALACATQRRPGARTLLTERTNGLMLHLMKYRSSCKRVMTLAVVALWWQVAPVLMAQYSAPPTANPGGAATVPAIETHPVQLSSGVADILKLGRAHVSDETITAFISNSGETYHLSVSEILYLREQGVSDQVLRAMLSAGQNVAAISAQAAPQPVAPSAAQLVAPPAPTAPTSDWVNSNPQPAPVATQYAPAYDAAAPVYAQPSPVYAYPAPSYGYDGYGPYYWGYPALSLGFGFGGGYYGGYYGRGYYGGGYHGGGYHGGGGWHR